eukprot:3616251-Pleurochrysis_carterae.AAC.3
MHQCACLMTRIVLDDDWCSRQSFRRIKSRSWPCCIIHDPSINVAFKLLFNPRHQHKLANEVAGERVEVTA